MFAATAILSYVIKIRGLLKSTKWRHFKISNLKLSPPGVLLICFAETLIETHFCQVLLIFFRGSLTQNVYNGKFANVYYDFHVKNVLN